MDDKFTLGSLCTDVANIKSEVAELRKDVKSLMAWKIKVITLTSVLTSVGWVVFTYIVAPIIKGIIKI